MTTGILSARVRQGIALMDLHHGEQWVWGVDTLRLNITRADCCVIGQVNRCRDDSGYLAAADRMGVFDEVSAIQAGFFHASFAQEAALNRLWAYAIRRLREQRPKGVAA